jgi:glycosyltransferase involved in cell wall biosynthesis
VDPLDPAAIARAIRWIWDHPEEAQAMGDRGRTAVQTTYNWVSESRSLVDAYERILS